MESGLFVDTSLHTSQAAFKALLHDSLLITFSRNLQETNGVKVSVKKGHDDCLESLETCGRDCFDRRNGKLRRAVKRIVVVESVIICAFIYEWSVNRQEGNLENDKDTHTSCIQYVTILDNSFFNCVCVCVASTRRRKLPVHMRTLLRDLAFSLTIQHRELPSKRIELYIIVHDTFHE